jgi:hypothetical protein
MIPDVRRVLFVIAFVACSGQGNAIPNVCPARLPSLGTACEGNLVCGYEDPCGGRDTAQCSVGRWVVDRNSRACVCPEEVPQRSSPCNVERGQTCTWNNSCGGTITGSCAAEGWVLDEPACP